MISHAALRAIQDASETGKAILKFISPNDAGVTGGHQCGFYLPKGAWHLFSPHPPEKITDSETDNPKSEVEILWENGQTTQSVVTWYGKETRSEYRLTRFGRDFPYLHADMVGSLLVLVTESHQHFRAYTLETDEDIEEVQAALGIEITDRCGVFDVEAQLEPESEDECLNRLFREFAAELKGFPSTAEFSETTQRAVLECVQDLLRRVHDERLQLLVESEYELFRIVERQLCSEDIRRLFRDVDDFINTAATIMNRRKCRAGRSLENHVGFILRQAKIPFVSRSREIDGEPDIIVPGVEQYMDESYPTDRLCMIGIKTTCKDRWRQVLNEAPRLERRHILTFQPSISGKQLGAMAVANVTLVVPKHLHRTGYPVDNRNGVELLSVEEFVAYLRTLVA